MFVPPLQSYTPLKRFRAEAVWRRTAAYYDKDKEFLLELEAKVTHYELATKL
jgi:hypothetical protein